MNRALCLLIFFLYISCFANLISADTMTDLKIKARITNNISFLSESTDGKEEIDYFTGMPLYIWILIRNDAMVTCSNDLTNRYLTPEETKIKQDEFPTVKIGTPHHSWKSMVRIYLTDVNGNNVLTDFDFTEWEIPQDKKKISEDHIGFDMMPDSSFYIPDKYTATLQPGTYKLRAEYDSCSLSESEPDMKSLHLISQNVKLELKKTVSNYEKAQVLYHKAKMEKSLGLSKDYGIALLENAITLEPDFPSPYLSLGNIYFLTVKDREKAREYFKKYIEVINTTPLEYWSKNKDRRERDILEAEAYLQYLPENLDK